MKQAISIFFLAIFSACGDTTQTKAVEQEKEIQSAIKAGTIATSADGYFMKATIDGKDWEAASMMPPDVASRIVGYLTDQYIGLPYSKTDLIAGKKIAIGEDNAVDLSLNDGCVWKDTKGEIEITKANGQMAEGTFFFTTFCSSTNRQVEVRDGSFRILLNNN